MTVRLSDACWSRILTELSAAQVFGHKASSVYELHSFMENAVFQTPANLELKADDWGEAEAFVLPEGTGAAAAAALRLLYPLRFLTSLSVLSVEDCTSLLPLRWLGSIAGVLGPCLTRASRCMEASSVQRVAAILRHHLAPLAPSECLLAARVVPFLESKQLPDPLRNPGVSEAELCGDLEDGIEYWDSRLGARNVEEKRAHLLIIRYVAPS